MSLKKRLTNLYVIKAILLLFLPLMLIVISGETRESISDYAYSDYNMFFVMLLTIAGTLFINNGVTSNKFYNSLLGLSLFGIALIPHLDYPILHYSFAFIFFGGSIFIMIYFSSKKQRIYKIIASVIILIALVGVYLFKWYSLLIAEWIGLVPLCLHFVGESLNKID